MAKSPENSDRGAVFRTVGVMAGAAMALAACAPTPSARFATEWAAPFEELGLVPVNPPQEDLMVGDGFVYAADPEARSGSSSRQGWLGTTARWTTVPVLGEVDSEYRQRPVWPATSGAQETSGESIFEAGAAPTRLRLVSLVGTPVTFEGRESVNAFIPPEAVNLAKGTGWDDYKSVTVTITGGESYALALDRVAGLLVDEVGTAPARYALKERYRRFLPLHALPTSNSVWIRIVTEVIYVRSLDYTVQAATPPDEVVDVPPPDLTSAPPPPADDAPATVDPQILPFRRAAEINRLLVESNATRPPGSTVAILSVTDESVSLRRTWTRALAIAVRGLTFEVDKNTGAVLRMGPMGSPLPNRPPVSIPAPPDNRQNNPQDNGS